MVPNAGASVSARGPHARNGRCGAVWFAAGARAVTDGSGMEAYGARQPASCTVPCLAPPRLWLRPCPFFGRRPCRRSHAFGWRDAMEVIVRWRQLAEPNDQVGARVLLVGRMSLAWRVRLDWLRAVIREPNDQAGGRLWIGPRRLPARLASFVPVLGLQGAPPGHQASHTCPAPPPSFAAGHLGGPADGARVQRRLRLAHAHVHGPGGAGPRMRGRPLVRLHGAWLRGLPPGQRLPIPAFRSRLPLDIPSN